MTTPTDYNPAFADAIRTFWTTKTRQQDAAEEQVRQHDPPEKVCVLRGQDPREALTSPQHQVPGDEPPGQQQPSGPA